MKHAKSPLFLVLFALSVPVLILLRSGGARAQERDSFSVTALDRFLPPEAPVHAKMSSALHRLDSSRGEPGAPGFGRKQPLNLADGLVRVVVEAAVRGPSPTMQAGAALAAAQAHIQGLGGKIEIVSGQSIQCRLPVGSLSFLADSLDIAFIRTPLRSFTQSTTSEGVATIGANAWRDLESFHHGDKKVKVCVLDAGFKGYSFLLGSELPKKPTIISFRADGDVEYHEHGAACAEIVYDIAPDAEYYLANLETELEHKQAVDWIIGQGIDVVSYSLGWLNAGDGRGTGPICADIKRATQSGVVWTGAAGNYADKHWEGDWSDPDGDGWHNFSGDDEMFEFITPAQEMESVYLNWDDWGTWNGSSYPGSSQDYDLCLFYWSGSDWVLLDTSESVQSGAAGQWPTEEISGWYHVSQSVRWGVAIRRKAASRGCRLELFFPAQYWGLEYLVAGGSLAVGPDAAEAIAVGATSWADDEYHNYSSRGPTHDGRIKPEICAPSGVTTSTWGELGFFGTSASAPHAAGAFALLLGKTTFSKEQAKKIIFGRAIDLGAAGADNLFGVYGRINLKK